MTLSSWTKLAAAAALIATTSLAGDQLTVETLTQPAQYIFKLGDQTVMRYRFAPDTYKSYIADLHTTRGDNVLRDAPFDHLHHHALMYGIVVNGVNFWEEMAGAGVQKCVSISQPDTRGNAAGQETSFTQVLYWLPASEAFLPNTNSRPLLIEERTIRLAVDPESSEVAVHWKGHFTVGSRTNTVVLTGANYHGLGMRFQQELDPVAMHFYPGGKPDLGGNKQDHSAHSWEAVAFGKEGRPSTLAVFGHPENKRGEPVFFSMRTPFAYLAATQALDREPLVYKQGDRFELNYLITLYPETKSEQDLSARARKWESTKQ
jgi:hypothetical protein